MSDATGSILSVFDTNFSILKPRPSDWVFIVGGLHVGVVRGQEPSAFHRWMQRWMLGIHWKRQRPGATA